MVIFAWGLWCPRLITARSGWPLTQVPGAGQEGPAGGRNPRQLGGVAEAAEFLAGDLLDLGDVLGGERRLVGRGAAAAPAGAGGTGLVPDLGRLHAGPGEPGQVGQRLVRLAEQVLVADGLELARRQAVVQPGGQAHRPAPAQRAAGGWRQPGPQVAVLGVL